MSTTAMRFRPSAKSTRIGSRRFRRQLNNMALEPWRLINENEISEQQLKEMFTIEQIWPQDEESHNAFRLLDDEWKLKELSDLEPCPVPSPTPFKESTSTVWTRVPRNCRRSLKRQPTPHWLWTLDQQLFLLASGAYPDEAVEIELENPQDRLAVYGLVHYYGLKSATQNHSAIRVRRRAAPAIPVVDCRVQLASAFPQSAFGVLAFVK